MPTKDNREITVTKLDHQGRGIGYIDNKIVFIENALPEETVKANLYKENSKIIEGITDEIIIKSPKRVKSKCPYFEECGGCHLRHLSYEDTLKFKENKVLEILEKYANIENINVETIKNASKDFYRNKAEFKIEDGIIGYYKTSTHKLVPIERCLNVEESLNKFLMSADLLNLNSAKVTVKTNNNGEIILIVETEEENNIDINKLRETNKLVGIIYNNNLIYGSDHFIEVIGNLFFKETYNSFFQVNRNVTEKLFDIIKENIEENNTVLDLCSGVGTLSIVASQKAKKVYGIEIVENAVKDALLNAKMNKRDNIHFMLGDAFELLNKIEDKIDTVIVDPPRSGMTKNGIESILNIKPKKIIYTSCDVMTLSRDLNLLKENYELKKIYILDMFSYTYHVETISILTHKTN